MGKVLVVDDEKSIRVTLCEFLKKDGYEADQACDALMAFQMIADEPSYDVILTDIIMPRISGIDIIDKIRMITDTVQIILMTGEPTVETAIKAVQNGANDYLTKPIKRDHLLKAVRRATETKELIVRKNELEKQNLLYQKNLEAMVDLRTQEVNRAMHSIISLLSTVVEVRDSYTAGHQRRVGNLAALIAGKMNLDEKTVEYLRIIGYIHDIGKIMIPSEILTKSGKLSSLEIQMIQNHPLQGYEMLQKVELPKLISETIYQHHERCDGSGYPRGLKKKQILPEAQILMVADVVEAMTSHRPYRPAVGLEAALLEIRSNLGVLYAQDAGLACMEVFAENPYAIDDSDNLAFPM